MKAQTRTAHRPAPDMTFAVDWVLKANYLSTYLSAIVKQCFVVPVFWFVYWLGAGFGVVVVVFVCVCVFWGVGGGGWGVGRRVPILTALSCLEST